MEDKKYTELIAAYLDNSISPEEKVRLNQLIDDGEIDMLEIEEMKKVFKKWASCP